MVAVQPSSQIAAGLMLVTAGMMLWKG